MLLQTEEFPIHSPSWQRKPVHVVLQFNSSLPSGHSIRPLQTEELLMQTPSLHLNSSHSFLHSSPVQFRIPSLHIHSWQLTVTWEPGGTTIFPESSTHGHSCFGIQIDSSMFKRFDLTYPSGQKQPSRQVIDSQKSLLELMLCPGHPCGHGSPHGR